MLCVKSYKMACKYFKYTAVKVVKRKVLEYSFWVKSEVLPFWYSDRLCVLNVQLKHSSSCIYFEKGH